MERGNSGEVLFWNAGAERLYGWHRDEIRGKDIHAVLRTVFPVPREEIEAILRERKVWHGNLLQKKKDGSDVIVACRKIMNHESDAVLEVSRDITAQLQAEEALRETEKLAAMGRVAGIIAHEINNPLAAITNIFFLIRNHPSLDEEARHCAAMAEQELQRVAHITRQTLSFYRESKTPIAVLLTELLDDVLGLQERQLHMESHPIAKTVSDARECSWIPRGAASGIFEPHWQCDPGYAQRRGFASHGAGSQRLATQAARYQRFNRGYRGRREATGFAKALRTILQYEVHERHRPGIMD